LIRGIARIRKVIILALIGMAAPSDKDASNVVALKIVAGVVSKIVADRIRNTS
jgi:hypothetical protein